MKSLSDHISRNVRLTDERLEHIRSHPEMEGLEREIEMTVQEPELVVQSISDPEVELLYRFHDDTLFGSKWMCVVVKYMISGAFVLTAYLTHKPKRGEYLWPRDP